MYVTQREITRCYLEGTDVMAIYYRRWYWAMGWACVPSLVTLYMIKSALGINIFEHYHVWDFLP